MASPPRQSPPHPQRSSVFQWPTPPVRVDTNVGRTPQYPPLTPSSLLVTPTTSQAKNDITLREVLEQYKDDKEMLIAVLKAKAEEDKRRAAEEAFKTEQVRTHIKSIEYEILKEQARLQYTPVHTLPKPSLSSYNVPTPSTSSPSNLQSAPPVRRYSRQMYSSSPTHIPPIVTNPDDRRA
ncbi:hypothetical protein BZG36_03315 [Bifiguratus adelaidae]|uniref:Uncharacterized protein n=1 Tax=Bifiguratus adelaidae TaxID=1938954 RepID=A0A261XXY6_9FUNG|nr:hypothetical protein BZG36_03315 [Bifiguratus adelaidae]